MVGGVGVVGVVGPKGLYPQETKARIRTNTNITATPYIEGFRGE
jgi:hypothetical protein